MSVARKTSHGTRLRRARRLGVLVDGAASRLTSCTAQGSMPGCRHSLSTKCGRNGRCCGITCLMRGNIGEVMAAQGGASFILSFLDEVVSVVSALGEAPKPAFLESVRRTLTTPGSTQSPSMFRDLQQGSPIEADQIIGDLLARGTNAGIPTPLLAAAYSHMAVYQRRLAAA